jgi:cysteinyl-tRNA synthetase
MITLFNTLGRAKEPFESRDGTAVRMYNCGPTVYGRAHLGNLRAYVFSDTLRRTLEYAGFSVTQVMNITDVGHLTSDQDAGEDKMMKGLRREGLPVTLPGMKSLAEKYATVFEQDIGALNIEHPAVLPRASEHITEQIALIQKLEERGFTYVIAGDGVYFDTAKDPHYGRLGGLTPLADVRADAEHTEKRGPRDFALWKFNPDLGWESPWGKGFPGWHIECSAMSMKYLGETLDIHTGGIDHIPVHHNNEIAQSENATGKPFARFWLHNAFLTEGGDKVAKSAGTALTLESLSEHNITPLAYRYWLLTAHYRSPMNFSWDALSAAQTAFEKLRARLSELPDGGAVNASYDEKFRAAIFDDLDTPKALSFAWDILRDAEVSDADKKTTILSWDAVFGLKLGEKEPLAIPGDVQKLLDERQTARNEKRFADADLLRTQIEGKGFAVKDTPEGQKISKL